MQVPEEGAAAMMPEKEEPAAAPEEGAVTAESAARRSLRSGKGPLAGGLSYIRGGQRYFFWRSASARSATILGRSATAMSATFQSCRSAMRYSAIAEASATRYIII